MGPARKCSPGAVTRGGEGPAPSSVDELAEDCYKITKQVLHSIDFEITRNIKRAICKTAFNFAAHCLRNSSTLFSKEFNPIRDFILKDNVDCFINYDSLYYIDESGTIRVSL